MNDKQKKAIKNVLVMLSVDGEISESEKDFISKLKKRYQIAEEEFTGLLQEFRSSSVKMSIPKGEEGRDVFKLLVEAAEADGKVVLAEQRLLQKVAKHVGMSDMESESLIPGVEEAIIEINAMVEDMYSHFNEWDTGIRQEKLEEFVGFGSVAVVPLLQVIESYRVQDGAADNLELKTLIAEKLGKIEDTRPVYYLTQQVNIGDVEDEISNSKFRDACIEAISKLTGTQFEREEISDGNYVSRQEKVIEWWQLTGKEEFNELVI